MEQKKYFEITAFLNFQMRKFKSTLCRNLQYYYDFFHIDFVRMTEIISKLFLLFHTLSYHVQPQLYMFNKETSCYEYLSDCRSDCHYSFIRMTIRTQFIFGYLQVLKQQTYNTQLVHIKIVFMIQFKLTLEMLSVFCHDRSSCYRRTR